MELGHNVAQRAATRVFGHNTNWGATGASDMIIDDLRAGVMPLPNSAADEHWGTWHSWGYRHRALGHMVFVEARTLVATLVGMWRRTSVRRTDPPPGAHWSENLSHVLVAFGRDP